MCDPAPPPASNHAGAILQNLHKNKTIKSTEEKEASDKAFHPHPVTRFGNVSVKKSADKYGGAVPAQAATTALSAAAAAAPAPSSLASVAMSKPAAQAAAAAEGPRADDDISTDSKAEEPPAASLGAFKLVPGSTSAPVVAAVAAVAAAPASSSSSFKHIILALSGENCGPSDKASIHAVRGCGEWGSKPLARDASTGLYAPVAPLPAGDYEGLLRIERAGGGGGDLWLPLPLEGLREGRSGGGANNRCWTILPAE